MFREAPITPIRPEVTTLAQAIIALVTAEADLARAKAQVPDYTGQYDREDYYAQELESRPSARLVSPLRGLYSFLLFAAPFPREEGAKCGDLTK